MVDVRSIGKRAAYTLAQEPLTGTVLACFEHVCDLVTAGGQLLALTWHGVPDGPFHLLLDGAPGAHLPAGTPFAVCGTRLTFDAAVSPVDFGRARVYDPQPDWFALRARFEPILGRACAVADLLAANAPRASLAYLSPTPHLHRAKRRAAQASPGRGGKSVAPVPCGEGGQGVTWLAAARRAIADIHDGQATGRVDLMDQGVAALCGLGPGLTPAGDDWLAGWLIGSRISNPAETSVPAAVRRHAPARTHALSRAFLECALAGDVDAHWQRFLDVLAWGPDAALPAAAHAVLARGATSGADMLAGFLSALRAPVMSSRGCQW